MNNMNEIGQLRLKNDHELIRCISGANHSLFNYQLAEDRKDTLKTIYWAHRAIEYIGQIRCIMEVIRFNEKEGLQDIVSIELRLEAENLIKRLEF